MKQFLLTILSLFILNATYAQVKATSSEINTGTDDDKFATALALQGSKYLDQNGAKISAVTAAGANIYVATITPAITAYISGQVFYIKITTANTGASTLNLNGLGAKALVKDASTPLVAGDLLASRVYVVYYDGTNFQVLNAISSSIGDHTGKYISKIGNDTFNGRLAPLSATALDAGLYGLYAVNRIGHIWSIGSSFPIDPSGAHFGTSYGMAYQYTGTGGNVTGGTKALNHQIVFNANGVNGASIGLAGNIWNNGWFRGPHGLVGSPTYSFINSPTTGMYSAGADALGFSAAGLLKMSVTPTGITHDSRVVNNTLSERIWNSASTVVGSRSFYDISFFNSGGGPGTIGELRIELPITGNTMWTARVTMMEYDSVNSTNIKTTDLIITGYAVSNTNFSVNCNNSNRIAQVRIGRNTDNTKTVLMIATSDRTLRYIKAKLKEVTVYHVGHTAVQYEDPANYAMSLAVDDADFTHSATKANSDFIRDNYTLNFSNFTNKPTTLAGYGITDAASQASVATLDANVVHKTGNETIAGTKLFSTSIGIGTTSVHSYKLAVGGGIIAESIKVKPQGSWPDYVFEKDYPILPLNELEKFVLNNKHLPNIPNAVAVKKEGIDIGEMNAKLLQKIEELTLYIIDQQKEIKDLRGTVNEMTKLSEVVEKLSAEINLLKNK